MMKQFFREAENPMAGGETGVIRSKAPEQRLNGPCGYIVLSTAVPKVKNGIFSPHRGKDG